MVDDEQSIRELVRDILEDEGYRVTVVGNGVEALETITHGDVVDLVISDIRMPVMGGIKLLEKIKEQNPFPPAMIFITGYSDLDLEDALAKGATAYLKKPMSISELVSAVSKAFIAPKKYKRQYERFNVRLSASVKFSHSSEFLKAEVLNVSEGGAFIAIEHPSTVGELVEFEIFFNEEKVDILSGTGEVAWQRVKREGKNLAGFGIKFLDVSSEIRAFIAEFGLRMKQKNS